ncbi:sigma-70 family RNA polymerase sigma factor [Curtobacterium herbarum]|uniref:sigma-70 family RNA polymerase sigma factor n=1 Tax=Curtobacterium herbarum TaxID=150122 RepID=UPI00195B2E04|nr:sigma-70 family RNA polymerase sigma factor [Curtobacterium herbarum]MBM7476831.1 RNA polymerase sigma-70 factor (ECF subfamily) [Curtobacterium herbarum]MCS6545158.1 sigma-70 family RNA polymerase sigma factor [Curtobacterium herbarum]
MDDELCRRRDEERALLLRVAAGDRQAFRQLDERFRPLVLQVARRQLHDAWLAEDVTQEVMLEVWRLAPRYDPSHPAIAWIRTIATRRAIDRVRKTQADRERDRRLGIRDHEAVDHSSLDRAEAVLDRLALRRALGSLPERQRRAVVLRYLADLSGPELGLALGVPTGTAKSRARDGVLTLRRTLVGPTGEGRGGSGERVGRFDG